MIEYVFSQGIDFIPKKEESGMNELIPTQQNDENEILVTGRDLHEFLGVGTEYRHWIKRMIDYGFSEGIDYVIYNEKVDGQKRTRTYEQQNHHIKLDMAKEISMLQRNKKRKTSASLTFLVITMNSTSFMVYLKKG